jgi:hypothetical protein
MRTLLRATTIAIISIIIVPGTPTRGLVAEAQPAQSESADSTNPTGGAGPEIIHLKHVTCGKYASKNRWIPVRIHVATGKITPLTHAFRKKAKLLKSAGRTKEVRRLQSTLTRLQSRCRTIMNSSTDGTTAGTTNIAPQVEDNPVSSTPPPANSPTPPTQGTPTVIPTILPDIPIPPAPAGGFSFALIDACSNRAVLPLSSDWSEQRNLMPLNYSIRANSNIGVQSVRFAYKGLSRLDNTPPFSLFGDTELDNGIDFLPGELPFGRTVIEVTGYSQPNGTGLPAATSLLTIQILPNPTNPTTLDLSLLSVLYLPTQLSSIDNFKLSPSGCLAVDGENSDGNSMAFELVHETQSWVPTTPTQQVDDSNTIPEGYQKIASSGAQRLLTYQKEPYECGWDGLSTLINGIQTDLATPFPSCVSIERGTEIPDTNNFALLGTSFTYSEDADPVATLHLARIQANGKPVWKVRLPFALQSSINVQNIAYIPQSTTDPLTSNGLIAVLLSIGDDPSAPLPPKPLLPGTNVVFVEANSGIVTNNQLFPAMEEPLKVTGLGNNAYGILSLIPNPGGTEPTQNVGVRIAR